MSVGVNPPRTPITEGSNGIAAATIPNVCKMPGPPAPFVPTPLPNIGKSGNSPQGYSTSVKIEGNAVAIKGATFKSMGDVASQGMGGGLISSNVQGPTSFIAPGSLDVAIEGKAVQLLGDQTLNNCGPSGSPANSACMMGTAQAAAQKASYRSPPYDCQEAIARNGWNKGDPPGSCECKQLCAKVKELNARQASLVKTNYDKNEYKNGIVKYKKLFADANGPVAERVLRYSGRPGTQEALLDWKREQFYDKCAYDDWQENGADPNPGEQGPKGEQEAYNPDHIHDAALGGDLEDMGNLKWLDSSVNKAIGRYMGDYDPAIHGEICLDANCGCDQ